MATNINMFTPEMFQNMAHHGACLVALYLRSKSSKLGAAYIAKCDGGLS